MRVWLRSTCKPQPVEIQSLVSSHTLPTVMVAKRSSCQPKVCRLSKCCMSTRAILNCLTLSTRHADPLLARAGKGAGEDDGYLVTYLHNENTNVSEFVVYDAKSMSAEPVAKVTLPRRVPYGFHGLHITEEQLKQQL